MRRRANRPSLPEEICSFPGPWQHRRYPSRTKRTSGSKKYSWPRRVYYPADLSADQSALDGAAYHGGRGPTRQRRSHHSGDFHFSGYARQDRQRSAACSNYGEISRQTCCTPPVLIGCSQWICTRNRCRVFRSPGRPSLFAAVLIKLFAAAV